MPITYASTLYNTERAALEASIYDFVTATGNNSSTEALTSATDDRGETIREARYAAWAGPGGGEAGTLNDCESWGVQVDREPVDFDTHELDRAFDAVAKKLRAEIAI